MRLRLQAVVDTLRRHTIMLSSVVGITLGSAAGIAYAFSHSANGLEHGFYGASDYGHVWITRSSGAAVDGVVAAIFYGQPWCGTSVYHTPETRYTANHVHADYGDGGFCFTDPVAGHISAHSPYLGHHEHNQTS